MAMMTAKQYAEYRKVNPSYIAHLKRKGFLDDALVKQNGKKRVLINSKLADELLAKNLDPNYIRGGAVTTKRDSSNTEYTAARAESERYRAKDRKLALEIKQGLWLRSKWVHDQAWKAGRTFRDALYNIGPRVCAIVSAETDPAKIGKILTDEINQVLDEFERNIHEIWK